LKRLQQEHSLLLKRAASKLKETLESAQIKDVFDTPVNRDARKYNSMFNEICRFQLCAICGSEGPIKGSVSVKSCEERLKKSNIKEMYESIIQNNTTVYETKYGAEMSSCFVDGLLKDVNDICKKCVDQLPEVRKKKEASREKININSCDDCGYIDDTMLQYESGDEEIGYDSDNFLDDDQWEQESENKTEGGYQASFPFVPTNALIRGLFTGSLPPELTDLTYVEQSMISIYSAISKITLVGGKHYQSKGATTYTIVNDLASVSKQLPRMPSIESTALLRHRNGDFKKDYKYRPNKVHRALIWLKLNNHLYKDIDIVYPTLGWETNENEINIHHVDISDEELHDYETAADNDFEASPEVSTNPGRNSFLIVITLKNYHSFIFQNKYTPKNSLELFILLFRLYRI
jgi:hypothetical protein